MAAKDKALYRTWQNMIARCTNPSADAFRNYGARGIKVCDRWLNSFDAFALDMGNRPHRHSIERCDNDGNYEPGNCKWATASEQARNKRNSRFVEIDGVRYHVAELAEKHGINMRTIFWRAGQGWPAELVFSKNPIWNNIESQKKAIAAHSAKKKAQTHCKRGHELSGDNLYVQPNGNTNRRACKKCRHLVTMASYYRRKGKVHEPQPV